MVEKKDSKFESSQIISMLPTFVWQTMIKKKIYQTINKGILKKLNELTQSIPAFTPGRSWQSNQNLHELKEFQHLLFLVTTMTKSVLEFLKIGHVGLEITGWWANINAKGTAHKIHSHPNNFLSGVYYV